MDNALDFRTMARVVRKRRRTIYWCTAVAGLLGLLLAVLITPIYQATIVIAPSNLTDLRGKSGALGSLAGLADLAGINVAGNDELEKSIAILSSRRFTDEFLREDGILQALFRDSWNSDTKSWRKSSGGVLSWIRAQISSGLRFTSGDEGAASSPPADSGGAPSAWSAFKRFNQIRDIVRDRKTGMISVLVRWRDPDLAAKWANDLIDRVNDDARNLAVHEAEERLAYLTKQLESVQSVGLREALINLTITEQRKAMLAHVEKAYAFQVIDPAVVPGERYSPKRTVLVFACLVLGAFLGFAFIFLRQLLAPPLNEQP